MHITSIKINNYKSIEEPLEVTSIPNLNILVGPNNAGKTNLLDAIQSIINTPSDEDRFFDSNTDIEMTFSCEGREYFLSNKNGQISYTNEDDFLRIKNSFIRIGDTASIYELIPSKLKEFKRNYPQ